jgi:putative zinc finger protein
MDQESLISLLRADADRRGERTPACPDEHELAAYVDGALPPPEGDSLEVHLVDCGWCLAVVGFLSRQRESPDRDRVSETQVAAARKLVTREPKRWGTRASGWAAAAAVAFLSILAVTQYSQLSDVDHDALPDVRATRNIAPSLPSLHVLVPGAGATVDGQHLLFRWSAMQGSDYYDIRIVSDSGDLIAEQRVEGTEWRPAAPLALEPGAEYFVQVEAHPSQAKTISSDHVPFLVSD